MIKDLLKGMLSSKQLFKYARGIRIVFAYHHINDVIEGIHSHRYTTSTHNFNAHLDLINEWFKVLPLQELMTLGKRYGNDNYCAITFDDGYRSILTHAHPVLRSFNMPYTIFINGAAVRDGQNWMSNIIMAENDRDHLDRLADNVGLELGESNTLIDEIMERGRFNDQFPIAYYRNDSPRDMYLDEGDLISLVRDGVDIGDHGWDHCVMSNCEESYLRRQLAEGKDLIERITGHPSKHFAIPFGKVSHYTPKILGLINAHGYEYVYSTNPNRIRNGHNPGPIPRIGLANEGVDLMKFFINRSLIMKYEL